MKCVVIEKPGGPESLRILEKPDPVPNEHQIRVQVKAAGVNFADTIVRVGYYEAAKRKYPIIPGFEFAGVVDAVGENVQGYRVGDNVFGFTLFGGYASCQITTPQCIRPVPKGWSFEEAAAIPAAHLTAYHALVNLALAQREETVLVHSAAGGVGLALVQQARALGCRVIGVVGHAGKQQTVKEFGAQEVLIRNKSLWKELDHVAPQGLDIVLDANGVSTPKPGFQRLRRGGRLLVYGFGELCTFGQRFGWLKLLWNFLWLPKFSPFEMTSKNLSVAGFNLAFLGEKTEKASAAMDNILLWVAKGKIKPFPVQVFPVEDVQKAHRALESGKTLGKLVLVFPDFASIRPRS